MFLELPHLKRSGPEFASCGAAGEENGGSSQVGIELEGQSLSRRKQDRSTEVGGPLAPDVASVAVTYQRTSSQKRIEVQAAVAQLSEPLQLQLKQPGLFGYFYIEVGGLLKWSTFNARAYGPNGEMLGSAWGEPS